MTDKELHKLGRRDLLQLLVQQGREALKVKQQLEETEEQLHQLEENYERLRKRLDQKDEQIHQLKDELETEKKKKEIKIESAGSIAEAALKLNGFFGAASGVAVPYQNSVGAVEATAPARAAETPVKPETAAPKGAASPGTRAVTDPVKPELRETGMRSREEEASPSPEAPRRTAGRSNSAKVVARMARARRAGR